MFISKQEFMIDFRTEMCGVAGKKQSIKHPAKTIQVTIVNVEARASCAHWFSR